MNVPPVGGERGDRMYSLSENCPHLVSTEHMNPSSMPSYVRPSFVTGVVNSAPVKPIANPNIEYVVHYQNNTCHVPITNQVRGLHLRSNPYVGHENCTDYNYNQRNNLHQALLL